MDQPCRVYTLSLDYQPDNTSDVDTEHFHLNDLITLAYAS